MQDTDLTFFTNAKGNTLLDRFKITLENNTQFFDVLVGYFRTSGFYQLYKSLEKVEKIRILVGINLDRKAKELIDEAKEKQLTLILSHKEIKDQHGKDVENEMEESEDKKEVELGVQKFIEFVKNGKLEFRAYPTQDIHAKVYIIRKDAKKSEDYGKVITGSSNFSYAGLKENLEFNVELKNSGDVKFALAKFEELWENSIDVSDKYIETINEKTWLNNSITPYELYLKFLYEYFKDDLNQSEELFYQYVPEEFKSYEYQEQAVLNAKKILLQYGGVFISDVVGLGKTYMAAMLAQQLDGRTLVIAPPLLIERDNPGSWKNVFSDFRIAADFESLGKLDDIIEKGSSKYANIIIDEAHRFRTESNITYEKLAAICRGKRVVLVTATPYNNHPKDILSQIKLFQNARKSTIPNLPDIERFFSSLQKKLDGLDRQDDYDEYMSIVRGNAKEIREKVLKYLMVRRTRNEIKLHFKKDMEKQGLSFPEVAKPVPSYYQLDDNEDKVFNKTIELLVKKMSFVRYMPLIYLKEKVSQPEQISQFNMGKLMKILLIKRLESSFFAFRNTIGRFIYSYEMVKNQYGEGKGHVYISKKHSSKIFELIENDDDEAIQKLIDEDKAQKISADKFEEQFYEKIVSDLAILNEIQNMWGSIKRDPKLIELTKELKTNTILKENKVILFTESKETAEYLCKHLEKEVPGGVLCFTGASSSLIREKVIDNFDARARRKKDDYRILISTEVLSEGVNLHRSNVVINYDIPWNPTRLMQRVGRINRIDTKFKTIYSFNFFPTKQSNDQIKLEEAAKAKVNAFISMLGSDARLLTEGEPVESHGLFDKLVSKKTVEGEDEVVESELKYWRVIKDVRDGNIDLFAKIKSMPKKARTSKKHSKRAVLTFFKKGKLQKFFIALKAKEAEELDFVSAAKIFESTPDIKQQKLAEDFYEMLENNKKAFEFATITDIPITKGRGGRDSATSVMKYLKFIQKASQFTDDQETYVRNLIAQVEEGGLPKQTTKKVMQELTKANTQNPLKILAILQANIPVEFTQSHYAENSAQTVGPREVILSEYLTGA